MEKNNALLDSPVVYEAGGQEIKLTGNTVKNYLTRGNDEVTDQEMVMFINLCKYQQLNPFLNEAYLVKFKGAPAQIITSKEAYMKRAFADPNFEGMRAGIIVQRDEKTLEMEGSFSLPGDSLLGGWAEIYVKGKKTPYVTKINLDEFSKGQATWRSMPKTMIRKTALVQALREAFPDNLGAMYTEEEQIVSEPERAAVAEVKKEIVEKANKEVIDIPEESVKEVAAEAPREKKGGQGREQKDQEVPMKGQATFEEMYKDPGF